MSALDLEQGDEERAEEIERKQSSTPRRVTRPSSSSGTRKKSTSTRPTAAQKLDTEIASRLERTFDRIIEALEERDDTELATAMREDKAAMSRGMVSLTRNVTPLRGPLLMLLNLIEPLLAFGRVGKILVTRFAARRARVMAEREAAMTPQGPVPVPEPETAQPWYEH